MIEDLNPQIVEDFRTVVSDFDTVFSLPIQYLNFGEDFEAIRWISRTPDTDYSDIDKLMKLQYGKVVKASPIYEHDTGNKYVIEINEEIYNVMTGDERRAFIFYLLSRIHICFGKRDGEVRFGLTSHYTASKMLEKHFGGMNVLPSPEVLAGRFG